ncbi:indole-3-glycerol phosphate synthase TrpC [Alicyclobacillus sp. ALC3]|uniref:indole-3-glycerol phosphate synthase TrpC n=1 Tax=Alicyclobacillus sp. ALC3 TaxID=2796143 RepID=UPI0023788BA5|nr:indole-3-glycerol phosphate synthase TrpC [Alicyclobacillus sp. ALC3]WDL97205.1 indole-3-glycerol phosphate synthase TrpC [Alicyclobacillus sp. ALC3]
MTTFLERILATKQLEVANLREQGLRLADHEFDSLPSTRGFATHLTQANRLTVVAEIKQASPSKGLIATDFRPAATARAYEQAGAAAISVLTDQAYFQGSIEDLKTVRDTVTLPVLRKDFIVDELQIIEARQAGADAVLLICAALSPQRLRDLTKFAQSLSLDVLLEVHSEEELEPALAAEPTVLGVNNRDLRTFEVRLDTSERIAAKLPSGLPFIAESGVSARADARRMAACGASGILVGEALMRCHDAAERISLLESLRVPRPAVAVREQLEQNI